MIFSENIPEDLIARIEGLQINLTVLLKEVEAIDTRAVQASRAASQALCKKQNSMKRVRKDFNLSKFKTDLESIRIKYDLTPGELSYCKRETNQIGGY